MKQKIILWIVSEYRLKSYDFKALNKCNVLKDQLYIIASERVAELFTKNLPLEKKRIILIEEANYPGTAFKIPDFKDVDTKLLPFVKENKESFDIRLYCDEEEYLEHVAIINENFSLQGFWPKEMAKFRDKYIMKSALKLKNCKLPYFSTLEEFSSGLEQKTIDENIFPIIIKPRARAGAVGVRLINNKKEFFDVIKSTQLDPSMMVEEFIDGDAYHIDSIIAEDNIVFYAACKYTFPILEAVTSKSYDGSVLLNQDDTYYNNLLKATIEIIQFFKLNNTVTHTEFLIKNDEIYFLETAVRPGGGYISTLYEKVFSFNIFNNALYAFIKAKIDDVNQKYQYALGFLPLIEKSGIIKKINIPIFKSNIICDIKSSLPGQYRQKTNSTLDGIGEIVLFTNDSEILKSDKELIDRTRFIIMESTTND